MRAGDAAAALLGALAGVLIVAGFIGPTGGAPEISRQAPVFADNVFGEVAAMARPSVVQVLSLEEAADGEESEGGEGFVSRLLRALEGLFRTNYRVRSAGSGVVVDKRGHIITNYHVIAGADRVMIKVYGAADEREAEIAGVDPMTDLALLKSHGRDLVPLEFADEKSLRPGQLVAAVGHPFNLEGSFTVGVISALGRSDLGIIDIEDFIQTDAPIYPGNSGGPLLDLEGRIVGVNTAVLGIGLGIGFAIPSWEVRKVVEELARHGKVERGRIGVKVQDLTAELVESLGVPGGTGALISEVEAGSPAARAMVKQGDVVVSLDGDPVKNPRALRSLTLQRKPGSVARLGVIRGGRRMTIKVTIGSLENA